MNGQSTNRLRIAGAGALAAALIAGGAYWLWHGGEPAQVPASPAAEAEAPAGPPPASGATFQITSAGGLYRLTLRPVPEKVPLRDFHAWMVRLTDASGAPVAPSQFRLRGGMPGHGHGMPADPQLIPTGVPGDFVVEGVKFNMAGVWIFQFAIEGPAGADTAGVEFRVDY